MRVAALLVGRDPENPPPQKDSRFSSKTIATPSSVLIILLGEPCTTITSRCYGRTENALSTGHGAIIRGNPY
jgi:hypothetical protein